MSQQRYDGIVQSTTGAVIAGATVTVRVKSSGAVATIYSDEVLTAKTNPMTSGSDGSFWFYAADDDYTIAATYGGTTYTLGDVTLHSPEAWRQFVSKAGDETLNNNNTLQDDDDLEFDILDGETWEFKIVLKLTIKAASDFQFKVDGPAGTGVCQYTFYSQAGVATIIATNWVSVNVTAGVTVPGDQINVSAVLHGHYTATFSGTVHFQWSQQTAVAEDTKVEATSFLIARKVSLT